MVRRKQATPMQRIPSGEVMESLSGEGTGKERQAAGRKTIFNYSDGKFGRSSNLANVRLSGTTIQLMVCVAGIYVSFLTWALLQERITKTPYLAHAPIHLAPSPPNEYFRFSIVLNTVQSSIAAVVGSIYLLATYWRAKTSLTDGLPTKAILGPLLLVSLTSSLASPFGYASLAHVDYLTFVLAKSCKLLPVMFLHITLFQKKFPLYKYLVVLAVTAGVVLFTLAHPASASQSAKAAQKSSLYGLSLLSVNSLLDGLTNTVQDHIFQSPQKYGSITGPQMMVSLNIISTWLTFSYLVVTPQIPGHMLPEIAKGSTTELVSALQFLQRHPRVFYDVLGFAACGAIGQVFIFVTLERFSSLILVTVTVTRKMLTMLLSVVWFGKRLTGGQWAGVGLVFAGVGGEGVMERRKKQKATDSKKKT